MEVKILKGWITVPEGDTEMLRILKKINGLSIKEKKETQEYKTLIEYNFEYVYTTPYPKIYDLLEPYWERVYWGLYE